MRLVGGIEAGGTKFICGIGTDPDNIEVSKPIPTRAPEETLRDVIGFFAGRKLKRIGIGSFGPLDLKRGSITKTTPKLEWRGVPIRSIIESALNTEVVLDTDVNAAALGEHRWGAARGIDNFVYLTVGTGIGGGAMVNGRLIHGLMHPEMGHIRIQADGPGVCPYHADCLEGYASGSAIARFGITNTAHHLAAGIIAITSVISPEMIILGGGAMKTAGLLAGIREELKKEIYVPMPKLVRPKLGDRAGVLGAIALAQMKL